MGGGLAFGPGPVLNGAVHAADRPRCVRGGPAVWEWILKKILW